MLLLLLTHMHQRTAQEKQVASQDSSPYEKLLDYNNYVEQKKASKHSKVPVNYNSVQVRFTSRQIEILKLVAQGLSNTRIAKKLECKETAVKLIVYRIMKNLEDILYEDIDRYYLVIIAQQFKFDVNLFLDDYE